MHDTLPLLRTTDFPPQRRRGLTTLQVNLGYRCNQSCLHCHVNAGPGRTEQMDDATVALIPEVLAARGLPTLDLTGGAPELHPRFRALVQSARGLGAQVYRPLQPDRPVRAWPGGPGGLPRRARGGAGGLAALLPGGQRGPPTRPWGLCPQHRRSQTPQRPGLWTSAAWAVPAPGLQPRGCQLAAGAGGAGGGLQAGALGAARRRVRPALCSGQHAHPALRQHPVEPRPVRRLSRPAQGQLLPYQSRPGHVPRPDQRGLARPAVRLRLQPAIGVGIARRGGRWGRAAPARPAAHRLGRSPIAAADHCYGCTAGQGSSCGGALADPAQAAAP
jgi:hypothetical protein